MIPDIDRTIVALATAARPSARAVVRLSGPNTRQVLSQVLQGNDCERLLSSKNATRGDLKIVLPDLARSVPAMVLYWPDQRSYTGQPSAELHVIGSMPIVQAIIARCCQIGASPAERGEFTLRAFLAGKLDLAQAEAVLGVIEADSPASLGAALSQLGGNLATEIQPLRDRLVNIVAELEAGLDFTEEDIQFISHEDVLLQLSEIENALAHFQSRLVTRSTSKHLPRAVLVGMPNSGKSTLFNTLCGAPRAIVSNQPGTTRDYLEHTISVHGMECMLIDTAGWENLIDDTPRALAQQQLHQCLNSAQLALYCVESNNESTDELMKHLVSIAPRELKWMRVVTKCEDSSTQPCAADASKPSNASQTVVRVSCHRGEGMDQLKQVIATELRGESEPIDPIAVVHHTAVRCQHALENALTNVRLAWELANDQIGDELVAAELRLALDELSAIIGEVHSDDILGEIFSRFCIGK